MLVLLVTFMLSGAAGLFYESVWSRYLSLFVGHSAYAQVITLVLFLGGMALGAVLVSRRTTRIRDPLLAYAVVELVVGVIGLVFHDSIYLPLTSWAYDAIFPALAGGVGLTAVKWTLAGLLILPQSILLGATFPLMTAGVLRRFPDAPGRVLALFYFGNSFGAAIGVLIAGFVLYPWAGLPGTILAAAMVNFLVALIAVVYGRMHPIGEPTPPVATPDAPATLPELSLPTPVALLLWVSAGTALASFIYEIAWIRLLSLVIGSATHSFEVMLSAFILGLALGAFWIRSRADRLINPLRTLGVVQLWMGGFALLSLVLYAQSFSWFATVMSSVARSPDGYVLFSLAKYTTAVLIMLPATFCAGMTLPIITRVLLAGRVGERAIGAVYGANTFGSIVGAGLAGLVLIPWLGLKGVLITGGALDMLLGVLIFASLMRTNVLEGRRRVTFGLVATAAATLFVLLGVHLDQNIMASSVFRVGLVQGLDKREIIFQEDGRTTTVHGTLLNGGRGIVTNGKPDGSLTAQWQRACHPDSARAPFSGDDGTQMLAGMVAVAHRPDAREVAVIGHGTGMTSHFFLASETVREVTTIEIEPAMVRGSRIFYPVNRRVFDDPRSHHVYDDAKSYFASANRQFDVILSEPSNPWVSGVAGLFTEEFYGRVTPFLAPGGVFAQWLHAYELSDPLVLSVFAALHSHFDDYRIYAVSSGDVLVIATAGGPVPEPDWSVFQWPAVREDLCAFLPVSPTDLSATLIADRAGLSPLFEVGVGINSDFFPVLDLGAEKTRFTNQFARGVMSLETGVMPLALSHPMPLSPDTLVTTGLALMPGPRGITLGNWLRRYAWGTGPDSGWTKSDDEAIRYRHRQFRAELLRGESPTSWRLWTTTFVRVTTELHGGTRLWIDAPYFQLVEGFLDRTRAPEPVRAAVTYRKSLAQGDLSSAASAADILIAESAADRFWLPADQLLDGSVSAYLALGQTPKAQDAWERLNSKAGRTKEDARLLLLGARILQARGAPTAP